MAKKKSEWELRRDAATKSWKAMTPHQQDCMLEMLKAWTPIRSRVSDMSSLDYDDLRAVDDAWYKLRNALVDKDVEVKVWDF